MMTSLSQCNRGCETANARTNDYDFETSEVIVCIEGTVPSAGGGLDLPGVWHNDA
jgi:hypothetical protein